MVFNVSEQARLDITRREALFIQSVARAHDNSILDEEDNARRVILEKFQVPEGQFWFSVPVTQDELKFLVKICRETFSFITRREEASTPNTLRTLLQRVEWEVRW